MNPRDFMRRELARNAGITLDDDRPQPAAVAAEPTLPREVSDEDRVLIREVLVAAGAPEKDLEWLVASCPSVEDALTYEPARPVAYCARCQGPRVCDAGGCIVCRTDAQAEPDEPSGRRRDL